MQFKWWTLGGTDLDCCDCCVLSLSLQVSSTGSKQVCINIDANLASIVSFVLWPGAKQLQTIYVSANREADFTQSRNEKRERGKEKEERNKTVCVQDLIFFLA